MDCSRSCGGRGSGIPVRAIAWPGAHPVRCVDGLVGVASKESQNNAEYTEKGKATKSTEK